MSIHITLIMVMSLDGRITRGEDDELTSSWASAEDQSVLHDAIRQADMIVMGKTTYEVARKIIRPSEKTPRVVLTSRPEQFADAEQPGLVFVDASPQELVQFADKQKKQRILLMGGAHTAAQFLDEGLVNEMLVTIEPQVFGQGTPLIGGLQHMRQLQLVDCKQLNQQGTLLARYTVLNDNQVTRYAH